MLDLKRYADYVPDVNVKKSLVYNFYARPAVEWKCSRERMKEAIGIMNDLDVDELGSGE